MGMGIQVVRDPFPHVVLTDWFDSGLLGDVVEEMPDPSDARWRRFGNSQESKLEGGPNMWGDNIRELLGEVEDMSGALGDAFGIDGLTMETVGGGYHLIPPGGYLAVHTDFNRSPNSGQFRRLNCLTYLNTGWTAADGGQLELWDAAGPSVKVEPEFGTVVVFETSDRSWHGHPMPTTRYRASVAAYFFTEDEPEGYAADHSTVWHPVGAVRA